MSSMRARYVTGLGDRGRNNRVHGNGAEESRQTDTHGVAVSVRRHVRHPGTRARRAPDQGMGQPVVAENRPGVLGNLASLRIETMGMRSIHPAICRRVNFDSIEDLAAAAKEAELPRWAKIVKGSGVRLER